MHRRQFVTLTALGAAHALAADGPKLTGWTNTGPLSMNNGPAPIPGAIWYTAEATGGGMLYQFPAGTLASTKCLTSDMLLDGSELAVFQIVLSEGEKGRKFRFDFGALNQCSFRVRVDLALVDQSRWMVEREGAFLKPKCVGDRVDLTKVDRMTFTVMRKGPSPVRWCMTELR